MIAAKLRKAIRAMLREGKSDEEIKRTAGPNRSIIILALRQVKAQKQQRRKRQRRCEERYERKCKLLVKKWEQERKQREKKRMADEYSDRMMRLQVDGMEKLRSPLRCKPCGAMTKMRSKKHKQVVCYECLLREHQKTTNRPYAAMCAALATLLLLVCGCQAPREFRAEAHVAGQFVKCELRR